MKPVNTPEVCFCACLCSPSCLHPLLVLPPGRPSAWCVRPFQGPKELYGRERYTRRSGRWRNDEQREKRSVGGSCSGGEGGETSLDIQLPLRGLFIARPLQLALSSAFHCLKRDGKRRERKNGRALVLGRERLGSMKSDEEVRACAGVGVAAAHHVSTLLSDSCSAR